MPEPLAGWRTSQLRVTLYYFTSLMTMGVATAYAGIWFATQGLTSSEIGLVGSAPVLLMLLANSSVGRLADRAVDWRGTIVAGALLGAAVPFGLFVANSFWAILIVWALAIGPTYIVAPVADAATIRLARRNGTEFGAIRAWGTIGYMAAIIATGAAASWVGGIGFLTLFVGVAMLRGLAALGLPRFREARGDVGPPPSMGARHLRDVMKPWFVLPLLGAAIIYGTHNALASFQALLWKEQGIPDFTIALLVALGAAAEAGMMFIFPRFARRFSARRLLLFAAIVAAIRWVIMGLAPPLPVLVALQLLHSITFALGLLASLNFIANWTSEEIAAEAQALFQVLQQAMAVVAVAGFGWIAGYFGVHAFFALAGFAVLGALLIWVSLRLQQPHEENAVPTL